MSDKNLDELLSGLKQEYERMPEQVDKQVIMQRLSGNKKKRHFGKVMPPVAVIAGLVLFMLVVLPYVGDYDQAENNPNYLEMYYLNALNDYKELLMLEDIEVFSEVKRAEEVVEYYGSSSDSEDYEAAKEEIDYWLKTPKEMAEEAKRENHFFADDEQFNEKIRSMLGSFQHYFSHLLVKYGIQRKDQDDILDARDNPESYQGPQEIKNFLTVLNEQGFRVSRHEVAGQLTVNIDFSWQLEKSEAVVEREGYLHYLELMTTITEEENEIPWNEMDSILLEIEYIYDAYPDEREAIFENTSLLLGEAALYLREYLALSLFDDEIDPEMLLEEYNSFLEANEDSRFRDIVKAKVDAIEAAESANYLNMNVGGVEVYLLFNEQFAGITFNDIINLDYDDRYRAQDTQVNYIEYSETRDEKLLEGLEGAEMALLYKYAFERRNTEVYSTLYAEDSKWSGYGEEELHEALVDEGWMDVLGQSSHAVIQKGSDKVTVTFIYQIEPIAKMEWVLEDGLWKLMDQSVEDIPQWEKGF